MKVLRGGDKTEHPLDRHYHELQCKLQPIDTEDKAFQVCIGIFFISCFLPHCIFNEKH